MESNNPKISVIMSTYCRKKLVKRAIKSIIKQTFKDFELILIDDGSIDGTKKILEKFARKDFRIILVRFERNRGIPAIRYNYGMSIASGKYFAFMFDDDLWYKDALQILYEFAEANPECSMVYANTKTMDARTNTCICPNFGRGWDMKKLIKGNYLSNNAVLVRKEVIDEVGGYDEAPVIMRLADWDLWIRIGKKFSVKHIDKTIGEVWIANKNSVGLNVEMNVPKIREHQKDPKRYLSLKNYWSKKEKH